MKMDIDIPSFYDLWHSLPESLTKNNQKLFERVALAYACEVGSMFKYAQNAKGEVSLSMSLFSGDPCGQIIAHFAANDSGKPYNADSINWHGQNTSRWLTAGCILVDGRTQEVSTHH